MANTGSLIPIHSHTNLVLLELFSETEDQVLLYRGKKIASVQEIIDFRDDFNTHVNNTDIHVTKNDKDGWDEHVADTVIHVTQADKDLWNATLENAKTYAKNLFDQVTSFKIHIVNELPTQDIDIMAIYFVRTNDPLTDNLYDEYMYIDNKWEIVGSLGIDFDAILADYVKKTYLNNNFYTKNQMDQKLRELQIGISSDAGNQLVQKQNGLYVPGPKISNEEGNKLEMLQDGLYVHFEEEEEEIDLDAISTEDAEAWRASYADDDPDIPIDPDNPDPVPQRVQETNAKHTTTLNFTQSRGSMPENTEASLFTRPVEFGIIGNEE